MNSKALLLALPLILACMPPPVPSETRLRDSVWKLDTLDGVKVTHDRARLAFPDRRVSASVGCNGMGGAWKLEGGKLVVDALVGTMMYCEGLMDQERAFSALLSGKPRIVVIGKRMTLEGAGHRAVLTSEGKVYTEK
jgi:heat shock protein HslJ